MFSHSSILISFVIVMLAEIKVVVVFDAAASGLSTHKETYKGVDVVYSGDLSADSWIEKEVMLINSYSEQRIPLVDQTCAFTAVQNSHVDLN
jgi:predicted RNA-binding protein with PIN domain